jgi:hypothetical protein
MRSLQHVCHLRDSIGSRTSSDIKIFLSTRAYGNREYSASTNLKARLWISSYRLLAYKEFCTLLWWSTRAPFPFDPPSTLFEFLQGKRCPPLLFLFPINSGHVLDIPKKPMVMSMSWHMVIPTTKFHCTTTSPSLQHIRYIKHLSKPQKTLIKMCPPMPQFLIHSDHGIAETPLLYHSYLKLLGEK